MATRSASARVSASYRRRHRDSSAENSGNLWNRAAGSFDSALNTMRASPGGASFASIDVSLSTASGKSVSVGWTTADGTATAAGLDYTPSLILTADEVKDISYIAAVIDTFLVMNGLGVLAALLVFAAMLMYLQTRQRSEIVSYGLSLRMGMRSSRHLAAIAIEVGAMLLIAFVAGTVLAIAAARLTVPLLDPIEAIPPDPITVVPVVLLALAAPALLLAALAGGWLTERRARSADLGQVMRLAD